MRLFSLFCMKLSSFQFSILVCRILQGILGKMIMGKGLDFTSAGVAKYSHKKKTHARKIVVKNTTTTIISLDFKKGYTKKFLLLLLKARSFT